MSISISDHALLRFLERTGGLPVEDLRSSLVQALGRAADAAASIGARNYNIVVDGMVYVVRGGTVATVIPKHDPKP